MKISPYPTAEYLNPFMSILCECVCVCVGIEVRDARVYITQLQPFNNRRAHTYAGDTAIFLVVVTWSSVT